jgi:hypothetical protein
MNPIVGAARTLGPESDCAGNDFTMRGSTFRGGRRRSVRPCTALSVCRTLRRWRPTSRCSFLDQPSLANFLNFVHQFDQQLAKGRLGDAIVTTIKGSGAPKAWVRIPRALLAP